MREVWHEGKRVDNESGLAGGGKAKHKEVREMTNEEMIKNMSTEELAEYLFDRGNGSEYCYDICSLHDTGEPCDFNCITHVCEWLREEQEHE